MAGGTAFEFPAAPRFALTAKGGTLEAVPSSVGVRLLPLFEK